MISSTKTNNHQTNRVSGIRTLKPKSNLVTILFWTCDIMCVWPAVLTTSIMVSIVHTQVWRWRLRSRPVTNFLVLDLQCSLPLSTQFTIWLIHADAVDGVIIIGSEFAYHLGPACYKVINITRLNNTLVFV